PIFRQHHLPASKSGFQPAARAIGIRPKQTRNQSGSTMTNLRQIDRGRLAAALTEERRRFVAEHPRSQALFEEAKASLLEGVPMNWMIRWAGDFPIFIKEGAGARFTDVDGRQYVDFCLGDTGAMTGHAPKESLDAIIDRLRRGTTFMLPTEDSIWVGRELQRRFG